ncbi:reverse transcriptase domain-containing protein [Georgenia sp. Marseille-Q6866]
MVPHSARRSPSEIYRQVTTLKHLRGIFVERVAAGTVRGRDGISPSGFANLLDDETRLISTRCRAGTYRFTPYRQQLILKGAGKPPREISIPTVRDRLTLRALSELLSCAYPDCVGSLPQTEVARVRDALAGHSYSTFVRIDIRDFYPSIDHDMLLASLGERIKKVEILRVLRRAVATPTSPDLAPRPRGLVCNGIPQGLSISNPLAEIYMRSLDVRMSQFPGISYYRFVDDILVLCSANDAQVVDEACRSVLAGLKLEAHPVVRGGKSETGSISNGFHYLGYVFGPEGLSVRPSSVLRVESHLASIYSEYRRALNEGGDPELVARRLQWRRNLVVTGCVFKGVASGWLQYFRQLDDLTVLKRLDRTVARLSARYGAPVVPAPKSFMRAYWAVRHPRSRSSTYVPNFDLFDTRQMENELRAMGSVDTFATDQDVKDAFYRTVSRAIRELERDVGGVS